MLIEKTKTMTEIMPPCSNAAESWRLVQANARDWVLSFPSRLYQRTGK
jgi:hypothetical protein